ncbi:hypothetical protein C1H46_023105 [Malus baccata]|uniref:Uncharacterized protein n=1 Tax=Malus baccata TaxID=106549 RepID=A0A540LXR0_MALBA|nr:hypothetical protein C1H46_023105 [Malus baccata]
MIGVRCCVDDPSGALVFSFGDFCVNFWGFGLGFLALNFVRTVYPRHTLDTPNISNKLPRLPCQLGVINMKCELVDPDGLLKQLRVLKSVNVDGIYD